MKKIVLATGNEGKRKEFERMLEGKAEIQSLKDYPDCPEVEETGTTFAENAKLKAAFVAQYTGLPALADDSGLEVDALDGAPGVYSARFAGLEKDDEKNNQKLLNELRDVSDAERTARFVCALAYIDLNKKTEEMILGHCEGTIGREPKGENGFGYDPLMYIPSFGKTLAEMSADEKNKISHRGRASSNYRTCGTNCNGGDSYD